MKGRVIGAAIMGSIGVLFIVLGFVFERTSTALEGGVTVDGQVVATPSSGSDGDTCTKVVRYVVQDVPYQVRSTVGTSWGCGDVGRTMQVSYLPDNPGKARVVDPSVGNFARIFQVAGGIMVLVAAVTVVSAVRRATSPETLGADTPPFVGPTGSLDDLDFATPPPPPSNAFLGAASLGPPPLPPPAVEPPPGWYLDPGDASLQRWWDGREWTEHRR